MADVKPTPQKEERKKSLDDVLKQVLDEALAARDRGENPDMNFVYKRTQDKMYEAEHGRPPPSRSNAHLNYIPPEPRGPTEIRRLVPVTLFDDDPWPVPPTPAAPATDAAADSAKNDDEILAATAVEVDDASVQNSRTPLEDFSDAADELSFWELRYFDFLRSHSLGLRRALPLLVEQYKLLTHRLIRAEKRFVAARDRAVGTGHKLEPAKYAQIEHHVERVRNAYVETHRSLTQSSYDPTNMNKAITGKIITMTPEQYEEWKDEDKAAWNAILAAFEEEEAAAASPPQPAS